MKRPIHFIDEDSEACPRWIEHSRTYGATAQLVGILFPIASFHCLIPDSNVLPDGTPPFQSLFLLCYPSLPWETPRGGPIPGSAITSGGAS